MLCYRHAMCPVSKIITPSSDCNGRRLILRHVSYILERHDWMGGTKRNQAHLYRHQICLGWSPPFYTLPVGQPVLPNVARSPDWAAASPFSDMPFRRTLRAPEP